MKLKLQIFIISIFCGLTSFSQNFKINQNGSLVASKNVIIEGKLNGKLSIEDILYPDVDFRCLDILGKPINVNESHSRVGDDYTFYYEGMTLYFSNVASEELTLALVEFDNSGKSFIELKNNNIISTSYKISKQFSGSNMSSLDIPDSGNLTIKFHDNEGASMTYERDGKNIKKIKIYF